MSRSLDSLSKIREWLESGLYMVKVTFSDHDGLNGYSD